MVIYCLIAVIKGDLDIMRNYFKIVRMMFASSKRLIVGAFVVMAALIAVEMAIPLGINTMIVSAKKLGGSLPQLIKFIMDSNNVHFTMFKVE
jgi:hypothetical protein